MNWTKPEEQRKFCIRFIALALLSGMALSAPLWRSDRRLPLSPLFESAGTLPPVFIAALSVLTFVLVALQVLTAERRIIFLTLPLFAALVSADLNRLQPWVYDYTFFLLLFGLHGSGESEFHLARRDLQLTLAAIYFWSGVQKLNYSYFKKIPGWLAAPFAHGPDFVYQGVLFFGLIGPFLEIAMALMLLHPSSRKRGIAFCAAAHLFILFALGPAGHGANTVIWPWNIAMAGLVFYLFYPDRETSRDAILCPASLSQALALGLFAIAPAGSFFGVWNHYLSSALYSGNSYVARIKAVPEALERMPPDLRAEFEIDDGSSMLLVSGWSLDELNVPVFPNRKVMFSTAHYFCRFAEHHGDIEMWLYEPPSISKLSVPEILDCVP